MNWFQMFSYYEMLCLSVTWCGILYICRYFLRNIKKGGKGTKVRGYVKVFYFSFWFNRYLKMQVQVHIMYKTLAIRCKVNNKPLTYYRAKIIFAKTVRRSVLCSCLGENHKFRCVKTTFCPVIPLRVSHLKHLFFVFT